MRLSLVKLTLFIALMSLLLIVAFFMGKKKFEYPVHFFSQSVPVPVAFSVYSGSAQWRGKDRVKIQFSHVKPPDKKVEPYLFCVGYVETGEVVCYILQSSQGLIVEKATFVEPFLDAVRFSMLEFASTGKIPSEVNHSISSKIPWQDHQLMIELDQWNKDVRTIETKDYFPW